MVEDNVIFAKIVTLCGMKSDEDLYHGVDDRLSSGKILILKN